jgi:hypothetical protein
MSKNKATGKKEALTPEQEAIIYKEGIFCMGVLIVWVTLLAYILITY